MRDKFVEFCKEHDGYLSINMDELVCVIPKEKMKVSYNVVFGNLTIKIYDKESAQRFLEMIARMSKK